MATSKMILDGDFDKIDFRGELVDGHLVAKGFLRTKQQWILSQ